jgi:hypothetical protein
MNNAGLQQTKYLVSSKNFVSAVWTFATLRCGRSQWCVGSVPNFSETFYSKTKE